MKLFVEGLPEGTTEERLMEYFSQFGDIEDIYVLQPFENLVFVTFAKQHNGKEVLGM